MSSPPATVPDDLATLKTALLVERSARLEAEARASGAEAMVAHLKLMIACPKGMRNIKLKRERFGALAERSRKMLDQLELQLEELEATAAEGASVAAAKAEVGACTAALSPLVELIRYHVLAAKRLHGDDTTVPVLAMGKTVTGRLWTYVRDDRPFGGPDPPAAVYFYSRNRSGEHPAGIWSPTAESSRPTPTPGSATSMSRAAGRLRSPRRRVGAMYGASSSCSPTSPRRLTTCSNAGLPLPTFSTTAGSALHG